MGAIDEKRVDDQSGIIKSISIGKAVQRIDIGLHRTAADLLEAPQQPDPFVVVSGLDKAAGDAIGRLEVGSEVLAQNAGIGSEEARGKQAEQFFCSCQVACITRTFPQRKKTLEQMHVRVLAAKIIGGRQAFQEAIAVGRAEIPLDKRQRFIGQGERLPLAGCLDIGRDRQKHEGVGVEIQARVGNGAITPDREDPTAPTVPFAVVTHHGGEGLLDQHGRAGIPAPPRRQGIGVDLARLGQQSDRNVGQPLATKRQALLEPSMFEIEACRCPKRKCRLGCPTEKSGSRRLQSSWHSRRSLWPMA